MSNTFLRMTLAAAVFAFGSASIAQADALFFEKAAVKTTSEATCLRFAGDVARTQGFQNVHESQSEVAGVKSGVYLSITCVGRDRRTRSPSSWRSRQLSGLHNRSGNWSRTK
jgi:hypothetical protein